MGFRVRSLLTLMIVASADLAWGADIIRYSYPLSARTKLTVETNREGTHLEIFLKDERFTIPPGEGYSTENGHRIYTLHAAPGDQFILPETHYTSGARGAKTKLDSDDLVRILRREAIFVIRHRRPEDTSSRLAIVDVPEYIRNEGRAQVQAFFEPPTADSVKAGFTERKIELKSIKDFSREGSKDHAFLASFADVSPKGEVRSTGTVILKDGMHWQLDFEWRQLSTIGEGWSYWDQPNRFSVAADGAEVIVGHPQPGVLKPGVPILQDYKYQTPKRIPAEELPTWSTRHSWIWGEHELEQRRKVQAAGTRELLDKFSDPSARATADLVYLENEVNERKITPGLVEKLKEIAMSFENGSHKARMRAIALLKIHAEVNPHAIAALAEIETSAPRGEARELASRVNRVLSRETQLSADALECIRRWQRAARDTLRGRGAGP